MPEDIRNKVVSMLHPQDERLRITECPAYIEHQFRTVKRFYPDFDPTPWKRTLRALYEGSYKYIWASDGRNELYNLQADPEEHVNLISKELEIARKMSKIHDEWAANLNFIKDDQSPAPAMTTEERRRLESLGYVGPKQK